MKTDVPQPPPRPWKKGKQADYEVIHILLEICQDDRHRVFSSHRPAEREDEELALTWRSGGLEQTAFAFLTEAIRREAILQTLLFKSNHPDLFQRLEEAEGEEREKLVEDLRNRLEFQLQGVISRLALGAVEEALHTVSG